MNYLSEINLYQEKNINVIIEIPKGTGIKYELPLTNNYITVVRFLNKKYKYPFNYGSIPRTLAEDGDALDAILLGCDSLTPLTVVNSKVIGMIKTIDNGEEDHKILLIPSFISSIKQKEIKRAIKFLLKYKYPYNKDTQVDKKIYSREDALKQIEKCNKKYNESNTKTLKVNF